MLDAPFRSPWTFGGHNPCRNIDELVTAIPKHWDLAAAALQNGDFARFFQAIQRGDLANLAKNPVPDSDFALHNFLEKLPSQIAIKPAIDVAPRRVHFTDLRRGVPRIVRVSFLNRGTGLLHGKINVLDHVEWLSVETTRLRCIGEQIVELRVDPNKLPGSGNFFARLRVESNGGSLEIPVQADLKIAGIRFKNFEVADPFDLAKVMLAHPKRAAKWLADGEIAEFFQQHGWRYPIEGSLAPSLGAVQQYFEALRLSSIPSIHLEQEVVEMTAIFPELINSQITLHTTSKKWIYASAVSEEMWLKPVEHLVAGPKTVELPFSIDSGLLQPGRIYEGIIQIRTNGGQELSLVVRLDVRRPFEPWTRKILRPFTG